MEKYLHNTGVAVAFHYSILNAVVMFCLGVLCPSVAAARVTSTYTTAEAAEGACIAPTSERGRAPWCA